MKLIWKKFTLLYSGLVLMLAFAVGYSSFLYGWQVRGQIPFPEKIDTTPSETHPQAGSVAG